MITVPNIKYLKSRFFLSFIYNTFTFYNTPTGYITKKTTNQQPKKDSGKEYLASHVHWEELKLRLVCTTGQNKQIKWKRMRKIK